MDLEWVELPDDQLWYAISGNDAADRFICGMVNFESKIITLGRGDSRSIFVPFDYFKPFGDGTEPDFRKLSIDDYGDTVAFGEYEMSAEAILYDFDERVKKRVDELNLRHREES